MSGQHRVNLKIVCKENYKYEVQEKSPANQAVTMQQLAEEYWRLVVLVCSEVSHVEVSLLQSHQGLAQQLRAD